MSVAVAVGVIALAGLAVEIAVLMLVYLNQARATLKVHDGDEALQGAIVAAASQRLRPILMTTATVVLGLSPIMLGDEAGSQIMQRIAAPMIGGMLSALVLALIVVPTAFLLRYRHQQPDH